MTKKIKKKSLAHKLLNHINTNNRVSKSNFQKKEQKNSIEVTTIKTIDKNSSKDLINIALEVWKINKKVKRMNETIGDEAIKWFEFPIERIYEILGKNNIKIIDHTGKKYLEWMNWFDIVSVEKDGSTIEPIFLDIISPIIEENGLVTQRWKVVILSK